LVVRPRTLKVGENEPASADLATKSGVGGGGGANDDVGVRGMIERGSSKFTLPFLMGIVLGGTQFEAPIVREEEDEGIESRPVPFTN